MHRISPPRCLAVEACEFSSNFAMRDGGALTCDVAGPTVTSSVFFENSAGAAGGAVRLWDFAPAFVNCSFTLNSSVLPGGAFVAFSRSIGTIRNCVLWADTPDEVAAYDGSDLDISHSIVSGYTGGSNNRDVDPQFVNGDPGLGEIDLSPRFDSPGIDQSGSGAPETDLPGAVHFSLLHQDIRMLML